MDNNAMSPEDALEYDLEATRLRYTNPAGVVAELISYAARLKIEVGECHQFMVDLIEEHQRLLDTLNAYQRGGKGHD